jgi:hypothetical protein
MSAAAPDSLLAFIHEELKCQIAETLTAKWKDEVLEIAMQEDREYTVFTAFRNALTAALEPVRQFPARYKSGQGGPADALPPAIARYRGEAAGAPGPLMSVSEHVAIVAKQAERSPSFASMISELRKRDSRQA